jgi:hypothetical protein
MEADVTFFASRESLHGKKCPNWWKGCPFVSVAEKSTNRIGAVNEHLHHRCLFKE